jgi:hypothetical protein
VSERDPHTPGWLAKDTARASERVKGWKNMTDELVAAHAAGREAGMREAAKKARGHIEFYFPDVPRAGEACEAAILSAIGTQEDSTSE